ncbi:nitrate- and nitrite sensing domain-containing protein [Streptomyces sp. NBC_00035]|uniref:nitrate- and nitrite sensing domain-containing protein n=1 Tax=Streptomyces sp. NBC_00035 TaxID=2903614 RepID=UPI0032521D89
MRFTPGVRGARLLVRRRRRPARVAGARPPLLARLRVRTKLMLLVLPPVAGLLAFTVLSAMAQWNEARTLEDFKASTEVSFATAGFYDAVARERLAEVLAEAAPDRAGTAADRVAARRATDRALTAAEGTASGHEGQPDVTGVLGSVDNQLHAVRLESGSGALTAAQIEQRYATVATYLLDTVRRLDSGRPTRASGRAGDAYLAVLGAIEAAARERVALAALLATPHPDGQDAAAGRWSALEAAQLDTFRQTASGPLRARLAGVLLEPAGRTVRATRETFLTTGGAQPQLPSLEHWLTASGARLTALRGIAHDAADELATDADQGLKAAQARGERELALSVGVLFAVTLLALVLGRSISRPLSEVSEGAKALAEGDLSYDVHYTGRDEIGVVADTFRELHVTSERLAAEIRTMSTAIDDNRLGHRADVAAFDGAWAQLLGGMNATMASFAAAHGRRRKAERELASIFHLSLDLLCICGTDGYFKRLNPAFERTLGHPAGTLLARPWLEFVHPADRARTRAVLDRLANGAESAEFENRCLRADGTERWLQWSARPVTGEGLIYAAARDVTESRRADREQAALRRVATLVARGDPPHEVFAAVAREVGMVLSTGPAAVLRYEADGAVTVLGSAHADTSAGEEAAAEVAHTRGPARAGRSVGAPIVVDDRLWGAVVAASTGPEPLPPGTESRLADFTELVATAIANADSQAQLRASRARVVAASDASRRRIERDLHDGVQQRLVSLQLDLRTAESTMEDRSADLSQQLAHISKGLDDAFEDLLQISRGIHPAILSRGGLGPALRALARRSAVPVELDLRLPPDRLPEPTEVAVYYVTSECLTNAVKHARATVVQVEARTYDDVLEVAISDDGSGGADPGGGSGLIGLVDRVEAIGGRLGITSPPGSGTTLTVRLPLRQRPKDG